MRIWQSTRTYPKKITARYDTDRGVHRRRRLPCKGYAHGLCRTRNSTQTNLPLSFVVTTSYLTSVCIHVQEGQNAPRKCGGTSCSTCGGDCEDAESRMVELKYHASYTILCTTVYC